MKVFALYDKATAVYGPPMFFQTAGLALRAVGDEVNRQAQDNNLYNHPADFSLHYLAEYDDVNGTFTEQLIQKITELSELKQ